MKYYATGNQKEALQALQQVTEAVDEMEAEIVQQAKEIEQLRKERDEARKMCCELEARIIVLEEDRRDTSNKFGTNPCSEIILADSPLARYPKEIAKRKGWDCFKEETP